MTITTGFEEQFTIAHPIQPDCASERLRVLLRISIALDVVAYGGIWCRTFWQSRARHTHRETDRQDCDTEPHVVFRSGSLSQVAQKRRQPHRVTVTSALWRSKQTDLSCAESLSAKNLEQTLASKPARPKRLLSVPRSTLRSHDGGRLWLAFSSTRKD